MDEKKIMLKNEDSTASNSTKRIKINEPGEYGE